MAKINTAGKRAWLQTGGMPLDPIHADLRAAFDQVAHVQYIGGACFKLQDSDGRQTGIIQFQGSEQMAVDHAVAATTERLATGAEKTVDTLAGDTVIRSLNMANPEDRALAEAAVARADASVVIPDVERSDPPPIDLPDYAPTSDPESVERVERPYSKPIKGILIGVPIALVLWVLLAVALSTLKV